MPSFEVNTDELAAGHGHQTMVAMSIGGMAGVLRTAATSVAGAAGHAGASEAGASWGAAWEGELAGRAEVVRRAAQNLEAAARAYRETDERAMPR